MTFVIVWVGLVAWILMGVWTTLGNGFLQSQ
jgi:hypothetical protein